MESNPTPYLIRLHGVLPLEFWRQLGQESASGLHLLKEQYNSASIRKFSRSKDKARPKSEMRSSNAAMQHWHEVQSCKPMQTELAEKGTYHTNAGNEDGQEVHHEHQDSNSLRLQ